MSNLSQFIGGSRPPKTIVNGCSSGALSSAPTNSTKTMLSGALTAGTLKTLLSITGAGEINYLALLKTDATNRTIRLKVTIDGVEVFDATSGADATAYLGLVAIGSLISSAYPQLGGVVFNVSLLVEVASSLTETDKLTLATIYETR